MAKILIVDDDPDIVEATQLILQAKHHEVASAGDRESGMKAVQEFQPDLLILDVMMTQPDDGLAMAQELRLQGFKAPILMLTSISRASGMEYGQDDEMVPVDDFQEKPVEPSVLVQKVEQLLKRKGA